MAGSQKSAKNENGVFGISALRRFRTVIICYAFGEKKNLIIFNAQKHFRHLRREFNNNCLMVLSIVPFSRTHPPPVFGGSIDPPPLARSAKHPHARAHTRATKGIRHRFTTVAEKELDGPRARADAHGSGPRHEPALQETSGRHGRAAGLAGPLDERCPDLCGPAQHVRGAQCSLMNQGGEFYARRGLGLCNAQLCTIMHNYARLCGLHFNEDTQGLQTRGNLGLRSPTNRQHSEIKTSSAVEACAGAFCWTKLSMINTTTNCIGQEWSRPLCTIMHNYAQLCNLAQL